MWTALSNSLQFRERDMQISLALRPQTQIPIPKEARRIRLKLLQAFKVWYGGKPEEKHEYVLNSQEYTW